TCALPISGRAPLPGRHAGAPGAALPPDPSAPALRGTGEGRGGAEDLEVTHPVVRLPGCEPSKGAHPGPVFHAGHTRDRSTSGRTRMTIKDTPEQWEVREIGRAHV